MNSENFTVDIKVNSTEAENKLKNLEALSQILEKKLNIDVGLNIDVEALNKKAENFVNNFENGIKNIFGLDDEKVANFNKRVDEINKAYQPKLEPYINFMESVGNGINNIAGAIEKEVEIAKKNQSDKEKINLSKTIAKETKEEQQEQKEDKKESKTSKTSTTEKTVISEVARGVGVPNSITSLANGNDIVTSGIIASLIGGSLSLMSMISKLSTKLALKNTQNANISHNLDLNPVKTAGLNMILQRYGASANAGTGILSSLTNKLTNLKYKPDSQLANVFHQLGIKYINPHTGKPYKADFVLNQIAKALPKLNNSQKIFFENYLPEIKKNYTPIENAYKKGELTSKSLIKTANSGGINEEYFKKAKEQTKASAIVDQSLNKAGIDWTESNGKSLIDSINYLSNVFKYYMGDYKDVALSKPKRKNYKILDDNGRFPIVLYEKSSEEKKNFQSPYNEFTNDLKGVVKDLKDTLIKFGKAESNTHYHINMHGAKFTLENVQNVDDLSKQISTKINDHEILKMYTNNFTRKA